METDEITRTIIGAAIDVHRAFGPGLLESAYEASLEYELLARGLTVERQCPMPLVYRGVQMECGYRLDLFVERRVIVEIKAVAELNDVHRAQVRTYLKLSGAQVALLFNFNVEVLVAGGLERIVEGFPDPPRRPRRPRR